MPVRAGRKGEAVPSPDGNDVREEQQESDDLQVPTACKVLKGHHDQGHHHQSPKEDLGETVHLQIKEANLEQERGFSTQVMSAQFNIHKRSELHSIQRAPPHQSAPLLSQHYRHI